MNRPTLFSIAILAAVLTAPACSHTQRIELPEQMTRVERKTAPRVRAVPAVPVADTPDPEDPKSHTPEVPISRSRQTHEGQEARRLVGEVTTLGQGETQAAITIADGLLGDEPHNARAQ